MKFKIIVSLTAVLTFINAILFLAIPSLTMSMFGRSLSATGLMNTRIAGACALGLSLVLWQLKDLPPSRMQTAISKILLLTMITLVVIDLHGILTGAVNQFGWGICITDILVAAGFLWVLFSGTIRRQ